ncbi:MAG: hypothetical protein JXA92_08005 [candidate division Zixibacteria bacterium]|nr:hypothetical protein [candidate division Zixibacteria bacterium]
MKLKILLVIASLMLLLVWFGCSDDSTTDSNGDDEPLTTQKNIGPDGDTLEIPGKIRLIVPPAALDDTVTVSMTQNMSPSSCIAPNKFVGMVFSIEPSGTLFDTDADLKIYYDPALLGSAEEDRVVLCSYTGYMWDTLPGIQLDTLHNYATADVSHLSDFAVLADTTGPVTEGVYAILCVSRMINILNSEFAYIVDGIAARFDSAFAPCEPLKALVPNGVICNEFTLSWSDLTSQYQYGFGMMDQFIVLDSSYTFTVTASSDVPALTKVIEFPTCQPTLTYPVYGDSVSKSGFTVTWGYVCGGTVRITLMDIGLTDSVLSTEVPNTGSYNFNSAVLSGLPVGEYGIVMVHQNWEFISASGYDSRSTIMARVMNNSIFYLKD